MRKLRIEKLDPRSEKGHFVGYPKDSLGYYIYFLANLRVVVARHVIFLEEEFIQEGGIGKKTDMTEENSFVSQIPDQIIE